METKHMSLLLKIIAFLMASVGPLLPTLRKNRAPKRFSECVECHRWGWWLLH